MKMKIPSICELQAVKYKETGDPLIDLGGLCPDILCEHRRKDSSINGILVRKSVAERLQKVQNRLSQHDNQMHLLVVEGYRTPIYQENYFLKQLLEEYQKDSSKRFEDLLEGVHQFVALPSIAGHPTGGAIDLTIAYNGKEVDMGGGIADFSHPELLPTFSALVTKEQAKRRKLLHDLMICEGFAPFYGEWWHFSYGDREWAAFNGMSEAIHSPIHK